MVIYILSFPKNLLKGLCTEHAYESLRHGSPQAGLFLFALRVVLPFVVYFKEPARKLKQRREGRR